MAHNIILGVSAEEQEREYMNATTTSMVSGKCISISVDIPRGSTVATMTDIEVPAPR